MRSSHTYPLYYRTFAKIDLDAIGHNLSQLQACLSPGVKTMAVVKADGYGHGSVPVARHIEKNVDYFAVADLGEALVLRENGIEKPILVLSYTSPLQYEMLIEKDVTATVYNREEAIVLGSVAQQMGKVAKVHIALDTGMGRIGFLPTEESADIVQEISSMPGITLEGLFSHYACADCADKEDAHSQTALFDAFISLLEERGVHIPLKHICNSAGAMDFTKQYDMCRLGIALYGLYPSEEMDAGRIALRPSMEVACHVIHIKTVPAGFKIGYGHIYTTPEEKKIATLSIGYADGFNRCLTDGGYVLINGGKAPVVGRVCMDQIMVDISHIPDVSVGDHAIVLGENEGAEISAETLGALCHSFNYEVVCNFMPRVQRIYYKNGVLKE